MISKTKYKIENKEIEKIFRAAGIGGITGISPLGAGSITLCFPYPHGKKNMCSRSRRRRRLRS